MNTRPYSLYTFYEFEETQKNMSSFASVWAYSSDSVEHWTELFTVEKKERQQYANALFYIELLRFSTLLYFITELCTYFCKTVLNSSLVEYFIVIEKCIKCWLSSLEVAVWLWSIPNLGKAFVIFNHKMLNLSKPRFETHIG